ncbi:MAG: hypothetical protein HKM93_00835 [Desulfobacteraceae bacterium]|nr:hypothetical protein [Desulfobacteraceae bacterium]
MDSTFEKRLKRRMIGQEKTFFVAVSPGFESVCEQELGASPLGIKGGRIQKGGVKFKGRLTDCYSANLHLRTATRILMRIDDFACTNFRQLTKKIGRTDWELYLYKNTSVDVRVTTRNSRLYHSAAIGERIRDTIGVHLDKNGIDAPTVVRQTLHVRLNGDRLTISIDSSGDPLFKRGLKVHAALAPIRESHAAFGLIKGGFNGEAPLIDPMSGSGSFSLEAAMMAKLIPTGYFRQFAFMVWPAFKPHHWEYIKKKARERIKDHAAPLIFASEADSVACERLASSFRQNNLTDVATVRCVDFFDLRPSEFTARKGMVALNPPYGHRIGDQEQSRSMHIRLIQKLIMDYQGWNLVLFTPVKFRANDIPFKVRSFPIFHGGLQIFLYTGCIR